MEGQVLTKVSFSMEKMVRWRLCANLHHFDDSFRLKSKIISLNVFWSPCYQTVQLMSLRGGGREKNCSRSSERNLAKNSFLEGLFSPALLVPLGLRNSQMVLVMWYS